MSESFSSEEYDELKKFKKNVQWFNNNYDTLKQGYKGEFVVVDNGRVIDHDTDVYTLSNRIKAKYGGKKSMHVDLVRNKECFYMI
jgi:Family of unknown function (DUF5678)